MGTFGPKASSVQGMRGIARRRNPFGHNPLQPAYVFQFRDVQRSCQVHPRQGSTHHHSLALPVVSQHNQISSLLEVQNGNRRGLMQKENTVEIHRQ